MNAILLLSALSILTLFAGAFNMKKLALPLIFIGLIGAFVLNLGEWNVSDNYFYNKMLLFDHYAVAFSGLLTILTLFIFFLCHQYYKTENASIADIYGLLIFVLIGGIIMASYSNLTMLFIGIEILSISLYILAGSRRLSLRSNEASIKYFLMGSFATGFLLFGIALVYGETHSFHLDVIRQYVELQRGNLSLKFTTGIIMMLIGLSFKVSVFPFHFWAPDVYEGSPTLVTIFMATVVKTAGFAALYRLFVICFDNTPLPDAWLNIVWGMAALTMTVGNFSALYQKGAKRMLAFSSVSNAGYLMIGVLAMNHYFSANAIFYYTAVYSLATIAAFGVLMLVEKERGSNEFSAFRGLSTHNPFLAGVLVISMLSLAGIPPLAGFFSKYYIFYAAIQRGYIWIVVIAIINSLIGIYYYFRLMISAFAKEPDMEKIPEEFSYKAALLLICLLIIALGVYPAVMSGLI